MTLTTDELRELAEVAEQAARAAGEIISARAQDDWNVEHKPVGTSIASQVVTQVDRLAQAEILETLREATECFDLATLAEESKDDGSRLKKHAFWSIDPMDGTLAFVRGESGYSVSIALVRADGVPLIGVVFEPITGDCYKALQQQGALLNEQPLRACPLDPDQPLLLQTDESFAKHPLRDKTLEQLKRIAGDMGLAGAEIDYRLGGVMNACEVLTRPNRFYLKYARPGDSGGSLWDYAATACLFQEAGGVASDAYGNPMELNRPDSTFMNHRGLIYAPTRELTSALVAMAASINAG